MKTSVIFPQSVDRRVDTNLDYKINTLEDVMLELTHGENRRST